MGAGSPAGSWVTESHPQEAPALGQRQERREEAAASELAVPSALRTLAGLSGEFAAAHKEPNSADSVASWIWQRNKVWSPRGSFP